MSKTISKAEYDRLIKAERRLDALEAGGVDNWDGYEAALAPLVVEEKLEETLTDLASDIETVVCSSIEEPAGRGCGVGLAAAGFDEILELLRKNIKELKTDD